MAKIICSIIITFLLIGAYTSGTISMDCNFIVIVLDMGLAAAGLDDILRKK